jgi:hypothetical protein
LLAFFAFAPTKAQISSHWRWQTRNPRTLRW